MSYSAMGDKPLSQDIEITKQFACNLETLLRGYFDRHGDKFDMAIEGIMAQAELVTDRLTDLVAMAMEDGEADPCSVTAVERRRRHDRIMETLADEKFREAEKNALAS